MNKTGIYCKTILCLTLLFFFEGTQKLQGNPSESPDYVADISGADRAYKLLQYDKAYGLYKQALSEVNGLEKNVTVLLKFAMSAYHSGHYTVAIEQFENVLAQSESYQDYIEFFKAKAYIQSNHPNDALRVFSSFASNHPKSLLADEASFLAGKILHAQEKFTESNAFLLSILDSRNLEKTNREARYLAGVNYFNEGKESDGLGIFYRIMERNGRNQYALESAEFIEDYRNRTKSEHQERELVLISSVFTANRDFEKARIHFNSYFTKYAGGKYKALAHFERGKYRYARRRYNDAIKDFEAAFATLTEPRLIRESRFYVARSNYSARNYESAIAEYDRYVRSYPSDRRVSEALWMIARIHERQGNTTEAIKAYKKTFADAQDGDYKNRAAFKAGYLYYKNKKYQEARDYFHEVRTKHPKTEAARQSQFWEAKSLEKLRRNDEAKNVYENLAKQKARSYYIISARKKINFKADQFNNTVTSLEKGEITEELKLAVDAGAIFGEPWGMKQLDQYRRKYRNNEEQLTAMYHSYLGIGRYLNGISLADFIYNRYYYGKNNASIFKALYPLHFLELVDEVLEKKSVDKALVYSIVRRESLFDHNAISSAGAMGLMQLMPVTAKTLSQRVSIKDFKTDDAYIPHTNLKLGIQNLFELMRRFKKVKPLVLAAYNAGDTPVKTWVRKYGTADLDEWIENIEYSETQTFVKEVLKNYYYYSSLYPEVFN